MNTLMFVYLANIIVAGWIGIVSLFFPAQSARTVFSGAYLSTDVIRLVGCLWLAIACLSVAGVVRPVVFAPVLVLQLIYKSLWLITVALPSICKNQVYPAGMAGFFLIWVLVLPFVIPWRHFL